MYRAKKQHIFGYRYRQDLKPRTIMLARTSSNLTDRMIREQDVIEREREREHAEY
jgi:hypothetical protein